MTRIPRVLVCVTGQKSCEHLIHVGAEIAREDGAELSVVHVAKMGANFLGSARMRPIRWERLPRIVPGRAAVKSSSVPSGMPLCQSFVPSRMV